MGIFMGTLLGGLDLGMALLVILIWTLSENLPIPSKTSLWRCSFHKYSSMTLIHILSLASYTAYLHKRQAS